MPRPKSSGNVRLRENLPLSLVLTLALALTLGLTLTMTLTHSSLVLVKQFTFLTLTPTLPFFFEALEKQILVDRAEALGDGQELVKLQAHLTSSDIS